MSERMRFLRRDAIDAATRMLVQGHRVDLRRATRPGVFVVGIKRRGSSYWEYFDAGTIEQALVAAEHATLTITPAEHPYHERAK